MTELQACLLAIGVVGAAFGNREHPWPVAVVCCVCFIGAIVLEISP